MLARISTIAPLLGEDACHAVRQLIRELLLQDSRYSETKDKLRGNKKTPIKLLQCSHPCRSRLIAAQERFVAKDDKRSLSSRLWKMLEIAKFCPIRWESVSKVFSGLFSSFLALNLFLEFEAIEGTRGGKESKYLGMRWLVWTLKLHC